MNMMSVHRAYLAKHCLCLCFSSEPDYILVYKLLCVLLVQSLKIFVFIYLFLFNKTNKHTKGTVGFVLLHCAKNIIKRDRKKVREYKTYTVYHRAIGPLGKQSFLFYFLLKHQITTNAATENRA